MLFTFLLANPRFPSVPASAIAPSPPSPPRRALSFHCFLVPCLPLRRFLRRASLLAPSSPPAALAHHARAWYVLAVEKLGLGVHGSLYQQRTQLLPASL